MGWPIDWETTWQRAEKRQAAPAADAAGGGAGAPGLGAARQPPGSRPAPLLTLRRLLASRWIETVPELRRRTARSRGLDYLILKPLLSDRATALPQIAATYGVPWLRERLAQKMARPPRGGTTPITSTVRGLPSEVPVGVDDGRRGHRWSTWIISTPFPRTSCAPGSGAWTSAECSRSAPPWKWRSAARRRNAGRKGQGSPLSPPLPTPRRRHPLQHRLGLPVARPPGDRRPPRPRRPQGPVRREHRRPRPAPVRRRAAWPPAWPAGAAPSAPASPRSPPTSGSARR